MREPVAVKDPVVLEKFGDFRVDPYPFLRNLDDPRTRTQIQEEKAYFQSLMAPLQALQEQLFEEMKQFLVEDWDTYPYEEGPYRYFYRYRKGLEYPQFLRLNPEGEEEMLLDPNPWADRWTYLDVQPIAPSPTGRFLAYGLDVQGDETYHLHLKDVRSGQEQVVEKDVHTVIWVGQHTLLFTEKTRDTRRPFRVWLWPLGQDPRVLYEEEDEAFYVYVSRSLDRRFGLIQLHSMDTTEQWLYHPVDDDLRCVLTREKGIRAYGEPRNDELWILTNREAPQFRVVRAPLRQPDPSRWEEVIPEDPEVGILEMRVFTQHVALLERREGRPAVRVLDLERGHTTQVRFPDPLYDVHFGIQTHADTSLLRLEYTTPVTPPTTFEYNMRTRRLHLRHRARVEGLEPEAFLLERIWVRSHDGTRVPVSVIRPRDAHDSAPVLLEGYGAYGHPYRLAYRPTILPLLRRGWACAVAHVRGGGELGERWHEEGKLQKKRNTFLDFVAVAEAIADQPWADADRLAIRGGSAGGLLIGAVLNLRPDLFRVALAEVPFVDVLNTMLDPSLPLTVLEYDEWGNPEKEEDYRTIRAYSPYDNIVDARYPHVLATAGLNDPRVRFWEPLKWIARLRDHRRGKAVMAVLMDEGAGHFGPSGRYTRLRAYVAPRWAFLLHYIQEPLS